MTYYPKETNKQGKTQPQTKPKPKASKQIKPKKKKKKDMLNYLPI